MHQTGTHEGHSSALPTELHRHGKMMICLLGLMQYQRWLLWSNSQSPEISWWDLKENNGAYWPSDDKTRMTECAKHYLGLKDGGSGLLILFQQESGFSWLIQFCQYLAAAAAAGSVNLQRERCQQSFLNLITSFINWFLGSKTKTISVNLHSV